MFLFRRPFLHEDLLDPSLFLTWPYRPQALSLMAHITSYLVLELLQPVTQALPASSVWTWIPVPKAEFAHFALHFLGLQWGQGSLTGRLAPLRPTISTEGREMPVGNSIFLSLCPKT